MPKDCECRNRSHCCHWPMAGRPTISPNTTERAMRNSRVRAPMIVRYRSTTSRSGPTGRSEGASRSANVRLTKATMAKPTLKNAARKALDHRVVQNTEVRSTEPNQSRST